MNIPLELVNRWSELRILKSDFVKQVVSKQANRTTGSRFCWFVWLLVTVFIYTVLTEKLGADIYSIRKLGILSTVVSGMVIFAIFFMTAPKISDTEGVLYRHITGDFKRLTRFFKMNFTKKKSLFESNSQLDKYKTRKETLYRAGEPHHALEFSTAAYIVWRELRTKVIWILNQQQADKALNLPNVPDKYKRERREIQDMLESAKTFGLISERFTMHDLFSDHGPTWDKSC